MLVLLFGIGIVALGSPPRLELPKLTNNIADIKLVGDAGAEYRIEATSNLVSWISLRQGLAAAGILETRHTNQPALRAWYYRGVSATSEKPFPSVTIARDPEGTRTTIVTAEEGGSVTLLTSEGIRYSLRLPTNSVFESAFVRLTALTALAGMPAVGGFLGGVTLEPADLNLAAPALLEIEFPTNLPTRQIASYSFDNDGTRLHLAPDFVATNRVRIFVRQLRGFGTGVFTLAELRALAATGPGTGALPGALAANRHAATQATVEECFADEYADAQRINQRLLDKQVAVEHSVSAKLSALRQELLLGPEEPANPAFLEAFAEAEAFEVSEIKPLLESAKDNCALFSTLTPWVLGAERQRQLLGATGPSPLGNYFDYFCPAARHCSEQTLECCRLKGPDTRLLRRALGIERQRQLLGVTGGECGALEFESLTRECAPPWYGTLTIRDHGHLDANRSRLNIIDRESGDYHYETVLTVDTVEESISPPILFLPGRTNLIFKLSGRGIGARSYNRRYREVYNCDVTSSRGRAAPADARPQDGGGGTDTYSSFESATTNEVSIRVTATLMDPADDTYGGPRLVFQNPAFNIPQQGSEQTTTYSLDATGCHGETETEPATDSDQYGGTVVVASAGGFTFGADFVRYSYQLRDNDDLQTVHDVRLELRRSK